MSLRKAILDDLDFLVRVDLKHDGYTVTDEAPMSTQELTEHRAKIKSFLTDPDKGAFVCEDEPIRAPVAMIMFLIRNRDARHYPLEIFNEIDRSVFPPDGAFLEVFQLWVHPAYRRVGLATALKRQLEAEAAGRGVRLIYTHTEETNAVALHLNKRLGYREVRRGPIWDEVIRISLVKDL